MDGMMIDTLHAWLTTVVSVLFTVLAPTGAAVLLYAFAWAYLSEWNPLDDYLVRRSIHRTHTTH